jgi:hypothetical protein
MKNTTKSSKLFSNQLEAWLTGNTPKTLGGLRDVFAQKSFAITFILLMSIPALPLPTGGITHVFEAIVMLMSFQMILGFQKFWLPKRLQRTKLKSLTHPKTVDRITRLIHWFERHSKPRLAETTKSKGFVSVIAVVIFLLTLAAFVAPPFSGLDTLPAMGVVVISLGLLLEDMLIIVFGIVVGSIGVAITVFLSDAIIIFFKNCFNGAVQICNKVIRKG